MASDCHSGLRPREVIEQGLSRANAEAPTDAWNATEEEARYERYLTQCSYPQITSTVNAIDSLLADMEDARICPNLMSGFSAPGDNQCHPSYLDRIDTKAECCQDFWDCCDDFYDHTPSVCSEPGSPGTLECVLYSSGCARKSQPLISHHAQCPQPECKDFKGGMVPAPGVWQTYDGSSDACGESASPFAAYTGLDIMEVGPMCKSQSTGHSDGQKNIGSIRGTCARCKFKAPDACSTSLHGFLKA